MLELLVCWAVIAVATFPIGHGLLLAIGGTRHFRVGDCILLAFWLGLIACEWLAAVTALFVPVTPAIFGTVVGLALAAVLAATSRVSGGFAPFRRLLAEMRAVQVLAVALIVLAAAFVVANLRATPDTGSYHFPAIRWLAEYGAVTGAAHIQDRFGFVSNVWAMLAPFDAVFVGRANGCINGFTLCLVSGQVVLASARWLRGDALHSDIFLGVASLCLLVIGLVIGSFSTPSPDPTVAGLTVVIAWRLLAAGENGKDQTAFLPLLLACGALNAKLSGLLLIPVAGLYAVWGAGVRHWIVAAVATMIAVGPFFAMSVIASGCLAFPASITCLPVPWALPREAVDELGRLLTLFTRWDSRPPVDSGAWNWIPGWLTAARFWLNALVFWPFVLSLCGYLWIARRGLTRCEIWVLALIAPSLVLVFAVAPEVRYNAGLFVILIALFAMRTISPANRNWISEAGAFIIVAVAVSVIEVGFTATIEFRRSGHVDAVARWLRPRDVPIADYTVITTPGLRYNLATAGDCWRAPLPCAALQLPPSALRAPERGIAGGFQSAR
jgi:hypothetical protein